MLHRKWGRGDCIFMIHDSGTVNRRRYLAGLRCWAELELVLIPIADWGCGVRATPGPSSTGSCFVC